MFYLYKIRSHWDELYFFPFKFAAIATHTVLLTYVPQKKYKIRAYTGGYWDLLTILVNIFLLVDMVYGHFMENYIFRHIILNTYIVLFSITYTFRNVYFRCRFLLDV